MRYLNIPLVALMILLSISAMAQNAEEIKIPLSNPGESGKLNVNVLNGSVKVIGYEGKEVIINAKGGDSHNNRQSKSKEGLKRISSNSIGFTAEEIDNKVIVRSKWSNSRTDFTIQVPINFSLKISTVNNGDVYVENVSGEFEISNTNGAITMKNISGSVLADALNDDIIITFDKVTSEVPMAFSSLNGDVDITFPANLSASINAQTDNGEVYTDFDIKVSQPNPKVSTKKESGVYKVTSEKGVWGTINNGGAKYSFKTLNGDIIIRSSN